MASPDVYPCKEYHICALLFSFSVGDVIFGDRMVKMRVTLLNASGLAGLSQQPVWDCDNISADSNNKHYMPHYNSHRFQWLRNSNNIQET